MTHEKMASDEFDASAFKDRVETIFVALSEAIVQMAVLDLMNKPQENQQPRIKTIGEKLQLQSDVIGIWQAMAEKVYLAYELSPESAKVGGRSNLFEIDLRLIQKKDTKIILK